MSSAVVAGVGMVALGFVGRALLRNRSKIVSAAKAIPGLNVSKYYKGGFEANMSRREASLVLGVSPNATITKIKEAHKRIMIANHPDRGGSPYLATKINEAKDKLESPKRD